MKSRNTFMRTENIAIPKRQYCHSEPKILSSRTLPENCQDSKKYKQGEGSAVCSGRNTPITNYHSRGPEHVRTFERVKSIFTREEGSRVNSLP